MSGEKEGQRSGPDGHDIERLADGLFETAAANRELANRLPTREKARMITRVTYLILIILAALAALTFFVLLPGQQQTHSTLNIVKAATSPASAKQQQKTTQTIQDHIILCVENHDDRFGDMLIGHPITLLLAGCPKDSIKAP